MIGNFHLCRDARGEYALKDDLLFGRLFKNMRRARAMLGFPPHEKLLLY